MIARTFHREVEAHLWGQKISVDRYLGVGGGSIWLTVTDADGGPRDKEEVELTFDQLVALRRALEDAERWLG